MGSADALPANGSTGRPDCKFIHRDDHGSRHQQIGSNLRSSILPPCLAYDSPFSPKRNRSAQRDFGDITGSASVMPVSLRHPNRCQRFPALSRRGVSRSASRASPCALMTVQLLQNARSFSTPFVPDLDATHDAANHTIQLLKPLPSQIHSAQATPSILPPCRRPSRNDQSRNRDLSSTEFLATFWYCVMSNQVFAGQSEAQELGDCGSDSTIADTRSRTVQSHPRFLSYWLSQGLAPILCTSP